MDNFLNNVRKQAKRIALTREEKDAARRTLFSFMEATPVRNAGRERLAIKRSFVHSLSTLFVKSMPIVLIVALLLGGGVSYGAEHALPGDALYPVKVAINEKVVGAFMFSTAGKADWETKLADRRLTEAEELAADEKLDESAQVQLTGKFEDHVAKATQKIEELREKEESVAAFEASSKLETALKAHKTILAKIAGTVPAAGIAADSLAFKVDTAIGSVESAREAAEGKIAFASPEVTAAAEGKLKAAENKIEEVKKFFEKKGVPADTEKVSIQTAEEAFAPGTPRLGSKEMPIPAMPAWGSIEIAEDILSQGKEKLAAGDSGGAFKLFMEAQRKAQEAKLLAEAEKKFGVMLKKEIPSVNKPGMPEPVGEKSSLGEVGPCPVDASSGKEKCSPAAIPAEPHEVPPIKPQTPFPSADRLRGVKEQAKNSFCNDISNKLYLVDGFLVFWDRRGNCSDASYSYSLFSLKTDALVCAYADSIAGPRRECKSDAFRAVFDVMVQNVGKTDLGLGSSHTVEPIGF